MFLLLSPPPSLHVCNSGCLFSLLEGRNCLCHALSSMARIKALECTEENLLCCTWSSTGTASFKLFSHFGIWVGKTRNYGGIHLKDNKVPWCLMHQCHIELVKYHHRKRVRCLDCCQLRALALSFYHSAVAVQAHSVISNKDWCFSSAKLWFQGSIYLLWWKRTCTSGSDILLDALFGRMFV